MREFGQGYAVRPAYAYKCTPHFGTGMVGFIIIGDPSINLKEVEGLCYAGRAKKIAAELIEQVKAGM